MDVIVIGAGVVGASVAFQLARAGAQVTVLEAIRPAAGTSSNSFAWINANDKPPRAYHDLNHAGVDEHRRLQQEIGGDWLHPTGNLEVALGADRRAYLREKARRLGDAGYAVDLIDLKHARELAPDLDFPSPGDVDVAFYPDEGWVAVPVLVHDLLHALERSGGRVVYPSPVTALAMEGAQVVGVETATGHYSADVVVDCGGPLAGALLEAIGIAVGRQRSPGLLIVTEPLPTCLARVVHWDHVYFRPDGAGRIRLGSVDVDQSLAVAGGFSADSPECQAILRQGRQVLPLLAGARIEGVRLGWRPLPADGLSAVGPVPDLPGYYLVFTHSGVTLGPLLGRLVAEELTTGELRRQLAPFRPDRILTHALQENGD